MKILPVILCLLAASTAQSNDQVMELDVSPARVSVGDVAVLSWRVTNARGMYLSSVGEVGPSGAIELHPDHSTSYSLVVDGPDSVSMLIVALDVEGAKDPGEPDCPRNNMFKYPYKSSVEGVDYHRLLGVFHDVLQDRMEFCVHEPIPRHGPAHFFTSCSEKSYLVGSDERTIGARRIAYSIKIEKPGQADSLIHYTVTAAIQYRKKIVRTWRLETYDSLYGREARRLNARNKDTIASRLRQSKG